MLRRTWNGCLVATLTVALVLTSLPASAVAADLELDPVHAMDPIPDIWEQVDGSDAREGSGPSWIWGPVIRSVTHEPYVDSPDGYRLVYYFDKARMEITDPSESWDSMWYATSGLLIREMMLGRIQVGDHLAIDTRPAEIPVSGDLLNNPHSPTYATLALHTSIGEGNGDRRATDRTGSVVTTKLLADGSLDRDWAAPATVSISRYDEVLGHNVADVFWDWMNDQELPWNYLIGHPLTEPFWVDTIVAGEERLVLVQAFERRILTYTPDNTPEWQIEAGNAGLHYRAWRGLEMPDDPALHALAHGIPYGEIIARAAERNGADPFVVAAAVKAASGFDPLAQLASDRVGLTGIPVQLLEQYGIAHHYDPSINVNVAADLLALLHNEHGSWDEAIRRYFTLQDGIGTFSTTSSDIYTAAIGYVSELRAEFEGKPSPFIFEEAAPDPEPAPPVEIGEDGLYLVGVGEAAHYSSGFTVEDMEEIMALHGSWSGGAIEGWEFDPNGYYCVHPDFIVGERLHLTAPNGETFWCTIADYVRVEHHSQWRSRWAIEVNWDLFEAMGVPYQQPIEVRAPIN